MTPENCQDSGNEEEWDPVKGLRDNYHAGRRDLRRLTGELPPRLRTLQRYARRLYNLQAEDLEERDLRKYKEGVGSHLAAALGRRAAARPTRHRSEEHPYEMTQSHADDDYLGVLVLRMVPYICFRALLTAPIDVVRTLTSYEGDFGLLLGEERARAAVGRIREGEL